MKDTGMLLLLIVVYLFSSIRSEMNVKLCQNEESCISSVDGENIISLNVQDASVWTIDIEEDAEICLASELSTCLLNEEENLIASTEDSSLFSFIPLDETNEEFLIQVVDSTSCITNNSLLRECEELDIVLDQIFLLIEEEDNDLDDDNDVDEDNEDDDSGFDYPIGILIFQLCLPLGFISVIIAFVYKYDLVPERLKQVARGVSRKQDVSKEELANIEKEAKAIQSSNRKRIGTNDL